MSRARPIPPLILSSLMLALVLSGCARQRAQMNVSEASQHVSMALVYQAEAYYPERVKDADIWLERASSAMDEEDYSAAAVYARQAARRARRLFDLTRAAHADELVRRAEGLQTDLNANATDTVSTHTLAEVDASVAAIRRLESEKMYEAVFERASRLMVLVDETLAPMRQEAFERVARLTKSVEQLELEGGSVYARKELGEARRALDRARQLADARRYLNAIEVAESATGQAADAARKAKLSRARTALRRVEYAIREAEELGAGRDFNRAFHQQCRETYAELEATLDRGDADLVFEGVPRLSEAVERLLMEARTEATQAAVERLEARLAELRAMGAPFHEPLAEGVAEVELRLAQARSAFDEQMLDEARREATLGMSRADEIVQMFSRLAEDRVRRARNRLRELRQVYERAVKNVALLPTPAPAPRATTDTLRRETLLLEQADARFRSIESELDLAEQRRTAGNLNAAVDVTAAAESMLGTLSEFLLGEALDLPATGRLQD